MTNKEKVDAAWLELMQSTISGSEWLRRVNNGYKGQPYDSTNTAFGRAKVLLDSVTNSETGTPLTYGRGSYGV